MAAPTPFLVRYVEDGEWHSARFGTEEAARYFFHRMGEEGQTRFHGRVHRDEEPHCDIAGQ